MGYAVDLLFDVGTIRIATYTIVAKTDQEAAIEAERWLFTAQSIALQTGAPMPTGFSLVFNGEVISTTRFAPLNDNIDQPERPEAPR